MPPRLVELDHTVMAGPLGQFYVDFDRIHVKGPDYHMPDAELKEWVFNNYKDELLAAMEIKFENRQSEFEKSLTRLRLLDTLAHAQRIFLMNRSQKEVYGTLLQGLLNVTQSEYGFIGEVKYEPDGAMYVQTHAVTNIAWDDATRKFYEENVDLGLKFYNMNTLFGAVLTTKQVVISNNPKKDTRAGGIPPGHPPLNHFLGIPFCTCGEIIGMLGIANKPGGYSDADVEFLEPLSFTCSSLIQAYWQIRKNEDLIGTLEEKVEERTSKLVETNERLEEANRKVLNASKLQLQHFACMSHEIRTPLNCIIGLASLLEETDLDPMQLESMKMITTSGDLLLTVVNDVLDYSKLETGNVEIEVRRCSLQETLNAIVHSIELKAQSKSLKVRTFYDAALPEYVMTDSRRLQQVLYNLLGNAIKFSKTGGNVDFSVKYISSHEIEDSSIDGNESVSTISSIDETVSASPRCPFHKPASIRKVEQADDKTCGSSESHLISSTDLESVGQIRCPFHKPVSVSSSDEKRYDNSNSSTSGSDALPSRCPFRKVEPLPRTPYQCPATGAATGSISSEAKKHMLRFTVKDYGKGIERKDFERIFQPFLQATSDTETNYGGTGLGLAITSKLAQALGGAISVDSEVGEWSEFTVDLPCCEGPVNKREISEKLRDTLVVLLENDKEDANQIKAIMREYNIKCQILDSLEAYNRAAPSIASTRTRCAFLVQEDLYQAAEFDRTRTMMPASPLFTFGSKYSVQTSDGHFRSLVQVLPSVLVGTIASSVERAKSRSHLGTRTSSTIVLQANAVPFRNLRVLIAEDNLINQKVLVRMLNRLGVEQVSVAENGRDAVDMEASNDFDVVLMDMQMPIMNGIEACNLIVNREGRTTRAPKVIFVTAHAAPEFELETVAAGASGFLPKPCNLRDIQKCFQQLDIS